MSATSNYDKAAARRFMRDYPGTPYTEALRIVRRAASFTPPAWPDAPDDSGLARMQSEAAPGLLVLGICDDGSPAIWDTHPDAHLAIIGRTGSGKTHLMSRMARRASESGFEVLGAGLEGIPQHRPAPDGEQIEGAPDLSEVERAVSEVHTEMGERLASRSQGHGSPVLLLLDECDLLMPSHMDEGICERAAKIAREAGMILDFGRAAGIHLVTGWQNGSDRFFRRLVPRFHPARVLLGGSADWDRDALSADDPQGARPPEGAKGFGELHSLSEDPRYFRF